MAAAMWEYRHTAPDVGEEMDAHLRRIAIEGWELVNGAMTSYETTGPSTASYRYPVIFYGLFWRRPTSGT